ncbi:MAG TPA: hydratase [Clostridiales bacterium]|nr:hydratase [Clostridiales bacterium]
MINLINSPVVIKNGSPMPAQAADTGRNRTIAHSILSAHDKSQTPGRMCLRFDSLISHDITYVGIIQTAKASGLKQFPVPYVLTNCHNSLCAVGGTINEDDHVFGLSAARKFGGIYVPANLAVIHQFAREVMSGVGRMILGSDSHTRYGALGAMGIGEGGPEIVRQLLMDTYDIAQPEVVLVWLTGSPPHGVGPHDVALALCAAVYDNGFVKNRIMEFAGPGVRALPMDFRIGIDVMSTETACLSSIWETDAAVAEYYAAHGRAGDYRSMRVREGAVYEAMVSIDLGKIEPMAALPFHPSKAYPIRELCRNAGDIFRQCEIDAEKTLSGGAPLRLTNKLRDGKIVVDQGIIAGCAGGMYDNIAEAAAILEGYGTGSGFFSLSVYPSSTPVSLELVKSGVQQSLLESGAAIKPCFCGPCFGAGDVPANGALSIRHTTRNFPNREGSIPADGQMAAVMLMDARSIAATAANGGVLTSAAGIDYDAALPRTVGFDGGIYDKRVYFGFGSPLPGEPLCYGPNIAEWPEVPALPENLLMRVCSVIDDPVTTTDELIPSGETSSYRSNPMRLAEFTLSRRDPMYVERAKAAAEDEKRRAAGNPPPELVSAVKKAGYPASILEDTGLGSVIYATKPGDGSAREQAASCQRVLGGCANICRDFATKRYRSNCVNWGMLPFILDMDTEFDSVPGDYIFVPGIRKAVQSGADRVEGKVIGAGGVKAVTLGLPGMTEGEREIILDGCLMNWYRRKNHV